MRDSIAIVVNSFNLKRQAHSVSRASRDQVWNPFRHIFWDRRDTPDKRVDTWPASARAEEGMATDKLAHALSAPLPGTHPNTPTRNMIRDFSNADNMAGSPQETDIPSPVTSNPAEERPRNRKPEDDSATVRNDTNETTLTSLPHDDEEKKKKEWGILRHVQPKTPFTVANQIQRTILSSWINVLMIAAPVGIVLYYVKSVNGIVVFVVNFIAIIPLAAILSFATEEIALRTGETIGGLLNASFGNAVELIIAIIALKDQKFRIVQTSLIGSILSNLLLVMGFCFFFGGLRRREQFFNQVVAQTSASLLALAAASVIVPTVFDYASKTSIADVASLSRGTSVILLIVYAAYLFFQLKTHQDVFNEESQKVPAKPWSGHPVASGAIRQGLAIPGALLSNGVTDQNDDTKQLSAMLMNPMGPDAEEDEEEPKLHFLVALATLAISTGIIAVCADCMVDSIDAVTAHISQEFVGLILLPIVGNAAEHATAVTVAIKDKMDLSIGVAVGSSIQVSLFLIPLLVVIGWGMGFDEMNLSFDFFQVAVVFVAVLLTNYLIADGKSHWLEGLLLICLYAIIAVCSFWYPQDEITIDRYL